MTATIHTLVIDDGTEVHTIATLTEAELYPVLRQNYADGFDGDDGDLVDFVTGQGVLLYFGQHTFPELEVTS